MKMHMILTIDSLGKSGDQVAREIASIQGFANSLDLPLRMQPEEDPNAGKLEWCPDAEHAVEDDDRKAFEAGLTILREHDAMPKKEFVRALAKRTKKPPRATGLLVRRWIMTKVMNEL